MITFFVQGHPVAWQRAGRCGNRSFTPKKTATWKTTIAWAAKLHRPRELMEGPLAMELVFHFKRPKNVKKDVHHCIGRSDVDNFAKSVMDALHDIFYKNDNQIVLLKASKDYGDPGVVITVGEIDEL